MKILLVDDDPRLREIVSLALTRGGYTVVTAADGNGASRAASSTHSSAGSVTMSTSPGMRMGSSKPRSCATPSLPARVSLYRFRTGAAAPPACFAYFLLVNARLSAASEVKRSIPEDM